MTLDEAINHAEEVVEIKEKQVKNGDWGKDSLTERNCIKCSEEHRQLAEWLKVLKQLREQTRWIPVSERLPEEKINPITQDFYEYQCTFFNGGIYDVRSYKFGEGHWWHGAGIMDDCVVAWRQRPEPYMMEG